MSNCNNDCENCKIEDFCGYSVDTLGYAEFSRVVEEHDAKVRADAIDKIYSYVKRECNPYGKPTIDFESGKKILNYLNQLKGAEE